MKTFVRSGRFARLTYDFIKDYDIPDDNIIYVDKDNNSYLICLVKEECFLLRKRKEIPHGVEYEVFLEDTIEEW